MLFTVVIGIEGRHQTAALNHLGMRTQIIGEIPPTTMQLLRVIVGDRRIAMMTWEEPEDYMGER